VKKNIFVKSKEVKTGCNLTESPKEGYSSKRALLPMILLLLLMMMMETIRVSFGGTEFLECIHCLMV
jgi:hypothetical protein